MKLLLLDGNAFCYRAFYAIRELRTSKGEPTNAVYGFIAMLNKLIKEQKPDAIGVTFDHKEPTFRHRQYEAYKIHRKPMPDDLVAQLPVIKEVLEAYRIPIYELAGYEADDLLGTIARRAAGEKHYEVFIATSDKDALQLVNSRVKVLNPQKDNLIYDEEEVKKRFGVKPKQVVEVLALMGDASDNIPGVPGIGEKTALELIEKYDTLEEVLKHSNELTGRFKTKNIKAYEDQARLSKELAVIDQEAPVEIDWETLKIKSPDTEHLALIFGRLEFRTLLKELPVARHRDDQEKLRYKLITETADFRKFVDELKKFKEWAFDFETTGTDPMTAIPVGISFSWKENEATYVSFLNTHNKEISVEEGLSTLKPLFEDERFKKIGQNIKYEQVILKNYGIDLKGVVFDTMVASYLLNPSKPNHSLDDIALEYLGVRITSIKELIGSGREEKKMNEVDLDKVYRYGCQDSDVTFRLKKILEPKLKEKDLRDLFEKMELPLIAVLSRMEFNGVAIDVDLLKDYSIEMGKELDALTKKIHKIAGEAFNINSPIQLRQILFEKLALPIIKKTKTGASTDMEVLNLLAQQHELPKELLRYRELSKLKSTYVDNLPALINSKTHRVHTSFNQTVAATGRLSSSEPNLQNIPARTQEGRKIRRAFVPGTRGEVLISADYSQIELRILAHLSGDNHLMSAFEKGEDIHRYTASLIFQKNQKEVTDAMRDVAKTVNFGILYGMKAFGLSKSLHITQEASADFIRSYFERYPKVKEFLDGQIEKAKHLGYVTTLFNRRRYIPEINSKDIRLRQFAERTAINAPIQGTASDLIKIAMIEIDREFERKSYRAKMILQVHDELVFETSKKEATALALFVKEKMEKAVTLRIPIEVKVKSGPNWLDMKKS